MPKCELCGTEIDRAYNKLHTTVTGIPYQEHRLFGLQFLVSSGQDDKPDELKDAQLCEDCLWLLLWKWNDAQISKSSILWNIEKLLKEIDARKNLIAYWKNELSKMEDQ